MNSIRVTGEIQLTDYARQLYYLDPRRRHIKLANKELSMSKKRTGNPLQFKVNLENLSDIPDVRDYVMNRGILQEGDVTIRDLLSVMLNDIKSCHR